ncbi:MAG: replication initiator protein A [Acutalibacter sp.]|nr:replication initiator protein A [Acutalibacter sp.]
MQHTKFDYFYGEESEQFSFFRIPRQLISDGQFRQVSMEAKLLYGMLLDRMELSRKSGWYDEQGRVYIYYPLEEIMENMNCAHGKATKLLVELDTNGVGLIERIKQGLGRPAKIYVKKFVSGEDFMKTPKPAG